MKRFFFASICGLLFFAAPSGAAQADATPIIVPLTMDKSADDGTYEALIDVSIGNLKPMKLLFNTGFSGLMVFAPAKLDTPDDGVECLKKDVSITYGNPPVIYKGVECKAILRFGDAVTPSPVPIAYIASVECLKDSPGCALPDISQPTAQGYGVFGAGLIGGDDDDLIPNPITGLNSPYNSVYSLLISPGLGTLELGASSSSQTIAFPLVGSAGQWSWGKACITTNGQPTNVCMQTAFDTSNGTPFINGASDGAIPTENGAVTPGLYVGFNPPDQNDKVATWVVSGAGDYASIIKLGSGAAIANPGIQGFFNHSVTFDLSKGVISFTPLAAPVNPFAYGAFYHCTAGTRGCP